MKWLQGVWKGEPRCYAAASQHGSAPLSLAKILAYKFPTKGLANNPPADPQPSTNPA